MTHEPKVHRSTTADGERRFGVFRVGPHLVGIPVEQVHEMFVLPAVHCPPGTAAHGRGVVTLRGEALPVVDVRVCLGMASARSEVDALVQLLVDREQDHRNWLAELVASVREQRPFTLATDPRKCKFGQWYYAYHAEDAVLRAELARIERPHAAIHGLAAAVAALVADGRSSEALAALEQARVGVLGEVVKLFEQARRAMRTQHREIGVAVSHDGHRTVLAVDGAEAVAVLELVSAADDPLLSGALEAERVERFARWSGAAQPVLLLDTRGIATGQRQAPQ